MNTNFFDKNAHTYHKNSFLQRDIASELIESIDSSVSFENVLDIGAGSGNVYEILSEKFEVASFTAQDKSANMLKLHKGEVKKICSEFSDDKNFDTNYSLIISSSSLQWDKNIEMTLKKMTKCTSNIYISIVTNNSLQAIFGKKLDGFKSEDELLDIFNRVFSDFEISSYKKVFKKSFDNKKETLEYIRDTGISGDIRKSWKDRKNILEFMKSEIDLEVLFIKCKKESIDG